MKLRKIKTKKVFEDSPRRVATAIILVLVFAAAILGPAVVIGEPSNSEIPIAVDSKGGFFQNFTISCYGCVPDSKYVWQAILTIPGIKPITISDSNSTSSAALQFYFGIGIPNGPNSTCSSGFRTNSTCVFPLYNTSLPFGLNFNFEKTSKGGTLQAIVYLANGLGFSLQTTSGNLTKTINYQSR